MTTATATGSQTAYDAITRLFEGEPEAKANPVPLYHAIREHDPIYFRESPYGNAWHLTHYPDIAAALKDPRFSAERNFGDGNDARMREMPAVEQERVAEFRRYGELWMLTRDPPDHTRLRGLVLKAFTPRVVESLRPHIEAIVDDLLAAIGTQSETDVIQSLAYPLPATVIAELLGVPVADRDRFRRWSDSLVNVQSFKDEAAFADFREMVDYLRAAAHARAGAMGDDLLSNLIAAREANDALTEDELIAQAMLLLVAGHETTTNLIGNGLLALMNHPDQLAKLEADPALLPNAVEELLRYDSPVQFTTRTVKEDLEFGGRRMQRGQTVFLWLGAANHDPAQFPDPDALDLARAGAKAHLSFATGIHFCIGAALARMEGQIALGALLRRYPQVRRAEAGLVQWRPNPTLRGLARLPVVLKG